MIVLDTNVISEPVKPLADPVVVGWLDRQPKVTLHLCAPVLMEVLLGISLLPDGKRKSGMKTAIQALLANYFSDRFLAFEREAAVLYASLASRAAAKGYSISVADCQIAAIAATHGFAVATRDTAPFLAAGVPVVNPWKS
ncbi:MAG TPA: type II toxin-antitoxin system VapC family toxin [Terracidiphilus sp.]|nr:type II toxin-antitoxin system VapC family toxin [Terracidiphilus sp.]